MVPTFTRISPAPMPDTPDLKTTNGALGRAAYEAWWAVRLTQPDPPPQRDWDDLTGITQQHWIKVALGHG
jgi:hypothetical protein